MVANANQRLPSLAALQQLAEVLGQSISWDGTFLLYGIRCFFCEDNFPDPTGTTSAQETVACLSLRSLMSEHKEKQFSCRVTPEVRIGEGSKKKDNYRRKSLKLSMMKVKHSGDLILGNKEYFQEQICLDYKKAHRNSSKKTYSY